MRNMCLKLFVICVVAFLFMVAWTTAAKVYKEVDYQEHFAAWIGGATEFLLDDRSRVDIVTNKYAIEVDFAYKWAESVGQALFYAAKTKKAPGIVLILDKRKRYDSYIGRLFLIAQRYDITVWLISDDMVIRRLIVVE